MIDTSWSSKNLQMTVMLMLVVVVSVKVKVVVVMWGVGLALFDRDAKSGRYGTICAILSKAVLTF